MKTRMAIDDISAMVGSIQKNVVNMRVTNIYDSDVSKTYILKLATPGLPKVFLLLQSGIRFHTTAYARETASALPLQFTMKLRKHLRGKRLASVTQCASDRVIDFCFGDGDQRHHLILELYAAGNIILTDHTYSILSLLRSHTYDEQVKVAVKQIYPMGNAMVVGNTASSAFTKGTDLISFIQNYIQDIATKEKCKKQYTLKQILMSKDSGYGGFGPTIVEHCIVKAHVSSSLKIKTVASNVQVPLSAEQADVLVASLALAPTLLEDLIANQVTLYGEGSDASDVSDHGFIILNHAGQFDEFTPYLYAQHEGRQIQRFHTFDMAVDEFFSKIEAQMAEAEKKQAAAAAETKVDKLKKHQQDQMEQFRKTQEECVTQAMLIEQNQQDVENVLLVIRSALANGMDWKDLEDLVKQEQKNGNPVASLIHKLDLAQNKISILLCDNDADDADMESAIAYCVPIDLSMSALANARELYSKKKKAVVKALKATEATDKAIEQAIKKHEKKQQQQKLQRKTMYQRRKTMWFEKFHWFITREKYLVLAGKDAQQNETLVKRYLRKGDLYVHADLHGAATCIIRNRSTDPNDPIPISTIEQAGCMSVCRSNAWSNQVIAGAYWVHADQVSKTAPTGEYLTTGSFMIRGKKNFIPASRLEMGLAIVFRIDESSIKNHIQLDAENDDKEFGADREAPAEEDIEAEITEVQTTTTTPEREAVVLESETKEIVKEEAEEKSKDEVIEKDEENVEIPAEDLNANEANSIDDEAEKNTEIEKSGKKKMSAKERRDLRKQRNGKGDVNTTNEPKPQPVEKKAPKNTPPPAPVRGKKGKLKKMKKYADQDEDERLLRLAALGHIKSIPSAEPSEATNDNDSNEESVDNDEATPSEAPSTKVLDEEKEAIYALHRERKQQLLEQEEEEAQNSAFLDSFTGTPLANDMLLFAMPMCAPYSTLALYTYKVKLTPGSQKKGKAAQFAMDHFLNLKPKVSSLPKDNEEKPEVDPYEAQKELMKCIPEADLVGCMVGPVKGNTRVILFANLPAMTDYSKWDKLEDSDDETSPVPVARAASPASKMDKMEAVRQRAHALMEKMQFAEGGALYKDLIAEAGSDVPAQFLESCRMNLAIAYIKQNLHHEVIPLCSEILKINPKLYKAMHFRGHSFMQMGFIQDASNDLNAALEGLPDDEGIKGDLATLATAQEAEVKLKDLTAKANEAFQAEDLDETIKLFKEALEEAIKVKRRDACGAINGSIGMALFKQNKHREAIPHFGQALQDMPHPERRMEFLEALSACHTVLGEGDLCVKALEGAIMIGVQAGAPPQRMVKLLLHAVRSCGMLKKTEEGLKYARKAKEIATAVQQWEIVFQCNEWIARLYTESQQPDQALASITEAFQEACSRVDLKSAIALMYIQMHVLKITDPMKHINLVQSTHAFFVSQKEFKGVLSCLEVLIVYTAHQFKTQGKDPKHITTLEEYWDEVKALPYEPMENEEKFLVLKLMQLQADFYVEFDTKKSCRKVLKEILDLAHAVKPIPPQHIIAEVFKKLTALSEDPSEQLENLVEVEKSLKQFKADVDSRIQTEQKAEILAKIAGDIADTLCNKAYCQAELGNIDDAEGTLAECKAICESNGIQNGRINCLNAIATGILALKRGNKEAAEQHFAEGLALSEASKDENVIAQVRELVDEARQKGGLPALPKATDATPASTKEPAVAAPVAAKEKSVKAPVKKTYPGAKLKKNQGSSLVEYIPMIVFMLFLAIFFHLVSQ